MIARLPNISTLNGSPIDDSQRDVAERFFIRHYMNDLEKPARVAELERIHGRLDPLVNVDFSKSDMAKVLLIYQNRKEVREIELSQTIGQFKKSLESFVGMASSKFRVFFKDVEASEIRQESVTEELKLPKQSLFSLRPSDGDEFHIQERIHPVTRVRNSSSGSSCFSPTKAKKKSTATIT